MIQSKHACEEMDNFFTIRSYVIGGQCNLTMQDTCVPLVLRNYDSPNWFHSS